MTSERLFYFVKLIVGFVSAIGLIVLLLNLNPPIHVTGQLRPLNRFDDHNASIFNLEAKVIADLNMSLVETQMLLNVSLRKLASCDLENQLAHGGLLSKSSCDAIKSRNGILLIQGGDKFAAFGATVTHVANQFLYAEKHNLEPFVYISKNSKIFDAIKHTVHFRQTFNVSVFGVKAVSDLNLGSPDFSKPLATQLVLEGDGVWHHYFRTKFSTEILHCSNIRVVQLSDIQIYPAMHYCVPWAIHSWPYTPILTWPCAQRHRPLDGTDDTYDDTWWFQNRVLGSFAFRLGIIPKDTVNRDFGQSKIRLGIHLRGTDKGGGRRVTQPSAYLPFVEAFAKAAGDSAVVFIATDDSTYLQNVMATWPRELLDKVVSFGNETIMSSSTTGTFENSVVRHRVNQEVLRDILMLSKCHFLIHSHSAVSEMAIYWNLGLHERSVNVEYASTRISPAEFEALVHDFKSIHKPT